MEISKEQFEAYEKVRSSGVTNMMHISQVASLSGLTEDQCTHIMQNYEELSKKGE